MTKSERQGQHRSKGRRLTVEQQQEDRSRAQFDERLSEFGWVVNPKIRDHGEDFLVDIYDGGNSTGLSFVAQLKSTDDIKRFKSKKDATILSYRLEVHDLKHWEASAQLVVVLIWDVTTKTGVWLTVPEIIKQIHKTRGWRSQKTITVDFPCGNDASDGSLHRLRRIAADHNYPIIKQGKEMTISTQFLFPNTDSGRAAARALREALDYGETAKIDGTFIKKWKMSDWWERLYGEAKPQHIVISSTSESVDVPGRLEIDTSTGTYTTPVDLRRVKGGRHGFTLDNIHQHQPLVLEILARRESKEVHMSLNLRVKHPVPDIFQTKDATDLLLALHDGRRMRVVHRNSGKLIVESVISESISGTSVESLREWRGFLAKLCHIQAKIYKWGQIMITDGRVSREQAKMVESFYAICTTGFNERRLNFSAKIILNKPYWSELIAKAKRGEEIEMSINVPNAGNIDILNVSVPLGPMKAMHPIAPLLEQVSRALKSGKSSTRVSVPGMIVREQYTDWMPEKPLNGQAKSVTFALLSKGRPYR